MQARQAGPGRRSAAARTLLKNVRRLRQELRPGGGVGEGLERALVRLQEHHPGHTGPSLLSIRSYSYMHLTVRRPERAFL